jgi:hypothetical protein
LPGPTSITIVTKGMPFNPAPAANDFNAAVRPSTSASEGDEDRFLTWINMALNWFPTKVYVGERS